MCFLEGNNLKKTFVVLGIVLAIAGLGFSLSYKSGYRIAKSGNDVTLVNTKDIISQAEKAPKRLSLRFIENEKDTTFTLESIDINLSGDNLDFKSVIIDPSQVTYSFDEEEIADFAASLNKDRSPGNTGKLIETEDGIRMTDESECNQLNATAITDKITGWLSSYQGMEPDTLEIDLTNYYLTYTPSEEEVKLQDEYQKYSQFQVIYTSGLSLNADDFYKAGLISLENGHISVAGEEKLSDIQEMLGKKLFGYNSVGETFNFTTHNGENITVKSETYGDYINYKEEAIEISQLVKEFKSCAERVPVMKQSAYSSLDQTYIEVDIKEQHAYYYKNTELLWDSDVVTGKMTKDRQTHTGVFFIFNKVKDAHLEKWNVDVERWMSVTYDGQGFHDASWRNAFGGNIYINNGSHGCINTPRDKMFELYDLIEIGTPVVIY